MALRAGDLIVLISSFSSGFLKYEDGLVTIL